MTDSSDLARHRVRYESAGLDVADVAADPLVQWQRWYDDAAAAALAEPNAMTLATVDGAGHPDARIVLCRGIDERSVVFYTNLDSAKSEQLTAVPYAAAVFGWIELHRQVRFRGPIERVDAATSDTYFASRPHGSQVGAWASPQSQQVADRAELDRLVAAFEARYADRDVPRPPYWGGWRLVVERAEFWQGRADRLHDRIGYRRVDGAWTRFRLAP